MKVLKYRLRPLLNRVYQLINIEDQWTKEYIALTKGKQEVTQVGAEDAYCFCGMGAILEFKLQFPKFDKDSFIVDCLERLLKNKKFPGTWAFSPAERLLREYKETNAKSNYHGSFRTMLIAYNDHPSTHHKDIRDLFHSVKEKFL